MRGGWRAVGFDAVVASLVEFYPFAREHQSSIDSYVDDHGVAMVHAERAQRGSLRG
jgi:hypothetical protein